MSNFNLSLFYNTFIVFKPPISHEQMVMEIAVRKPQIKGKIALVLVSDKDCKTIEKFCSVMKAFRNGFKINKETGMLIDTFTGCAGGFL